MSEQIYFKGAEAVDDFVKYINEIGKKILVVSGLSCQKLPVAKKIREELNQVVYFSEFSPNPTYESVVNGVSVFLKNKCDAILAIGGGSAMDVAKCIKLFSTMNTDENYLHQVFKENNIPLFAVPTTAGTGSEATKYAVIYYGQQKQSVTHESLIPQAVLFDASVLVGISEYQRKATMLDALCHAIESFWSVNSTNESRNYSRQALKLLFASLESYMDNETDGNKNMIVASNLAGRAINITQTTAAHAMCYKITSLYGLAHGHAASIVLPVLWEYMIKNTAQCIDCRGEQYVKNIFIDIAEAMGCQRVEEAIKKLNNLLQEFSMSKPHVNDSDLQLLVSSVNPVRLKNNPIALQERNIEMIYRQVFS